LLDSCWVYGRKSVYLWDQQTIGIGWRKLAAGFDFELGIGVRGIDPDLRK